MSARADSPGRRYPLGHSGGIVSVSFPGVGETAELATVAASIDAAVSAHMAQLEEWLQSHAGEVSGFELGRAGDVLAGIRLLHQLAAGMREEAGERTAEAARPAVKS
jgi:hypothetical protein